MHTPSSSLPRLTQMDPLPSKPLLLTLSFLLLLLLCNLIPSCTAQSRLCRSACGTIPIIYPLGIDDGCGSPYYRNLLVCNSDEVLHLRTPSGTYPVRTINYADPHLVVSDPSMWSCHANTLTPALPFSLDTSTRFGLSSKNDWLFFNCSEESVIVQPRSTFCERFPERCGSACDSAAYLCRNIPGCPDKLGSTRTSCCAYYPKASESLRLMLRHCASYTIVYWKAVGAVGLPPYDQVPEFGIRVDFEIPVTTRCLQCRDKEKGGGTCGFDIESRSFLCLCDEGNVTTNCADSSSSSHKTSAAVVIGTTTTVSVAGAVGIGALVWYLRKMKTNKVVTCGVQNNENRLF